MNTFSRRTLSWGIFAVIIALANLWMVQSGQVRTESVTTTTTCVQGQCRTTTRTNSILPFIWFVLLLGSISVVSGVVVLVYEVLFTNRVPGGL